MNEIRSFVLCGFIGKSELGQDTSGSATSAFVREESSSDALFFNEDLMDYPEIEIELSKIRVERELLEQMIHKMHNRGE